MNEIFYGVVSALLLYMLKTLFDSVVKRYYPQGEKLIRFQERFEAYKKLYYGLCIDFQSGKAIQMESVEKFSDLYTEYLDSDSWSELLSLPLQYSMRAYNAFIPSTKVVGFLPTKL